MGPGDRQKTTPSASARWRAALRPAPWAALLLVGASAGCGNSASDPAKNQPPLPRYWQGSIHGPQPDAWAVDWSESANATGADALVAAADSQAYEIPSLPQSESASKSTSSELPEAIDHEEKESVSSDPAAEEADSAIVAEAGAPGLLLPPQSVEELEPAPTDVVVVAELPTLTPPSPEAFATLDQPLQFPAAPPTVGPTPAEPRASAAPPTGAPTGAIVNERAAAKIRRGYELAERGAYFAARNQFVDALHTIAAAKDQLHGAPRRTLALAEGLRAIDEAADFNPPPVEGAAELKMSVIVASHQTPVAKSLAANEMLPQQLADKYFEYAAKQLGAAVAGEPTGSVALHAFGKLHSRLGRVEPERNPQADRLAFSLQRAALLARSDNHLAAHEIGVLLAESGHYVESDRMLLQVAQRAPHPVVFRNLARVERQLGRPDLAAASERQAEYLAARGNDPNAAVQWVPAGTLVGTPDPLAPAAAPMMARGPAATQR
jgi:hypothetical protein